MKPRTKSVRAFELRTAEGEHSPAIFATSSFVFESAEHAAAVFADETPGNIYSRFTNPTVQAFEHRLAAMEGADACVATASGMAAVLSLCLSRLKQGDHVLAAGSLFGSTISLLHNILPKFGIEVSSVNATDMDAWRQGVKPNTRLLFAETPANPLCEVLDIAVLAGIAHNAHAELSIDNCALGPSLQNPLALGADFVIYSATKYLDGQGRCVGGAVLGDAERVGKDVRGFMRTAGPCMSPFNAWVFLKGLETLSIRMSAHCENAQVIAEWLAAQSKIERVYYPGLNTHPQFELASRQQRGFGGIVAFDVKGAKPEAFRLINALSLLSITANFGDTRSTVTHPATTTHHRIGAEARAKIGIGDGLVRIGAGLEDAEDIIADLEAALSAL